METLLAHDSSHSPADESATRSSYFLLWTHREWWVTNADTDWKSKEMKWVLPAVRKQLDFLLAVGVPPAGVNPSNPAQTGHINHLKYFLSYLGKSHFGMVFLDVLKAIQVILLFWCCFEGLTLITPQSKALNRIPVLRSLCTPIKQLLVRDAKIFVSKLGCSFWG